MTSDLDSALAEITAGKTAFVGIGNPDRGDDAAGLMLAEALEASGLGHVFMAGANPENLVVRLASGDFESIVFLDAVDAGAAPGAVVLLDAAQLEERFPQVSTHRLSLGGLARLIGAENGKKVWLLGIQPRSIAMGATLSDAVAETVALLRELIATVADAGLAAEPERICN